jgi:hypothetical protein
MVLLYFLLFAVVAAVALGSFILKVGGRLMWKDPNKTWETRCAKSMMESSMLLRVCAILHCFSQIW